MNVQTEAEAHTYFSMGALSVCPDHKRVAWSADTSGAEFYKLRIRDLATGTDLDDVLEDVSAVAWADPQTLFYVRVDENHRPNKVFRHSLGTPPADDVLVYEETDLRYSTIVGRMRSGAFIEINTGMNDETEVLVIPTDAPDTTPRIITPRRTGVQYRIEHQGDQFVIRTNDNAVDFKVATAPVATPGVDNWSDLIAHDAGRMIIDVACYKDWTIWLERANALPRIRFMKAGGDPDLRLSVGDGQTRAVERNRNPVGPCPRRLRHPTDHSAQPRRGRGASDHPAPQRHSAGWQRALPALRLRVLGDCWWGRL